MRIEICGRGFLGSYSNNFLQRQYRDEVTFSSKGMQYGGSAPEVSHSDVFLNFSGPSSVEDSMQNPEHYLNVPVRQVEFQLKHLSELKSPPHYVFVSSASVYGDCDDFTPDENSALAPISPYALGKLHAENYLISEKSHYRGGITIIRATSIFADVLSSRVLGRIRSQLRVGEDFELYGDGSERRDFIHADDFLDVCRKLAERGIIYKGVNVMNVGSGKSVSLRHVLNLAIQHSPYSRTGLRVNFNEIKRPGDPHTISVSIQKLRMQLGVDNFDYEDSLMKYFAQKHW